MKIYIFDMDGTLTPARQPMTPDFSRRFLPWLKSHLAYLAAGSNYEKVTEQLPPDAVAAFSGIYSSMGNVYHQKGLEVYRNEIVLKKEFLQTLERFRRNTAYQGKLYGNYLELRPGMLNFSVLGRNCPFAERTKYNEWDSLHHERENIARELNEKFPEYETSVGGKISLDIVTKGCGKSQIARRGREMCASHKIIFIGDSTEKGIMYSEGYGDGGIRLIGDRTEKGGNDYTLAEALRAMDNTEVVQVNSPDDVLAYLEI